MESAEALANRRLRIALHAPGSNVHTQRWINALMARGHRVLLVSDEASPDVMVQQFDPSSGVRWFRSIPKLRTIEAQHAIRKRLCEFDPHLSHVHWLPDSPAILLALAGRRPLVVSAWGSDIVWDGSRTEPWLRRLSLKGILGLATRITATSHYLAHETAARCGREVEVIPFGVDCEQFRPAEARAPRAVPVIGYLKHYSPRYGPEVLLEAASILCGKGISFSLEMYGTLDPAPYRELIHRLGIADRVTVSGSVPHAEVPATLRRFDVYAMPSLSESFGVAALEASSCGVPVVASSVGGTPEVIRHGETGFLVPPCDPTALADALAELLREPERRHAMGRAGRAFVKGHYEWATCVDRMEALYEQVARLRA